MHITHQAEAARVRKQFDVRTATIDTILKIHLVSAIRPFCTLLNSRSYPNDLPQQREKKAKQNSLYNQRLIFEDEGLGEHRSDSVVFGTRFQNQTLVSGNSVLLQLLHSPLPYDRI